MVKDELDEVIASISFLTFADHIRRWTCIGIACFTSAFHCIGLWIVWADSICITTTIFHLTTIYKTFLRRKQTPWKTLWNLYLSVWFTCADNCRCWRCVCITSLARANYFMCLSIMWTNCIRITTTILHFTTIWIHEKKNKYSYIHLGFFNKNAFHHYQCMSHLVLSLC